MATAVLTLTRGLPGSGKTTWAKAQTAARPGTVRVNRDDLRAMMLADWPREDPTWERLCTAVQYAQVKVLLEAGLHVICDDTNLKPAVVAGLTFLAVQAGAQVRIEDFTDVPLPVCIARDAARPNPVGAAVITRMWTGYQATQGVAPHDDRDAA